MKRNAIVLALVMVLTVAACGDTTTADAECTPADLIQVSDETCYTRITINEFILGIYQTTVDFYEAEFENYPKLAEPIPLSVIDSEELAMSTCGLANSYDVFYCEREGVMYVGADVIWSVYSYQPTGELVATLAIPHEWGHALQELLGVFEAVAAAPPEQWRDIEIQEELQAECFAGAWAKFTVSEGSMPREIISEEYVLEMHSEPGPPTHGTSEENFDAYMLGVNGGVKACERFFPEHPLPD